MSAKQNINLEAIKLCKEKRNFLHYWLMELRFRFAPQPVASEQGSIFYLPEYTIPEATSPKTATKGTMSKEADLDPALSPQQVLADPACYPYLHHLTFSSDELLLSSSTASMIS